MRDQLKKIGKIGSLLMMGAIAVTMFAGCGSDGKFKAASAISIISREDGSGTRGAFIELFGVEEKDASGNKVDRTTKEAIISSATNTVLTGVAGNVHAIGYISLGSLNDTVKALKIDGVDATAANVKNGSYKIARPFNIATKGQVKEVAQDFINYILSADGQTVVAAGYIPVADSAASYSGNKPSGKIVVAGSSSVTPIMEKLKEAYLKVNPNAAIEIQQSDSTTGMTSATSGICDIGMASRELKDSEKAQLTATKIAIDGIAVIVNKENTAAGLTSAQVKAIYTGTATKWSDLSK